MKTFRVTHNNRRWILVTNLFYLALMGSYTGMAFMQFSPARYPSGGIGSRFPWAAWVFLLIFVLFAAMMTLLTIVIFKARLVVDEQGLAFETITGPLKFMTGMLWKPFSLPYERILRVRVFQKPGRLELIDRQGAKYTLTPISFSEDHGEAVLAELYARLPAEAFEPRAEMAEVRQYMARNRKLHRALVVVSLLYWIYLASIMAFNLSLSPPTWLNQAWQVRRSSDLYYERVEAYSPDHGAFWVISNTSGGYRVYHFSGRVDRQWLLPDGLTKYDSPRFVSVDETGSPIVWLKERSLHYRDGDWQSIPYNNLALEIVPSGGAAAGRYCWIIKGADLDKRLLKVDGLTGDWSPVPLPEADLIPHTIKTGPDGRFLVLALESEGWVVLGLSAEGWTGPEIPLGLEESDLVRDTFLDGSGNLWVLFEAQEEYYVRKIGPGGEWLQTRLPPLPDWTWQDGTRLFGYRSLLVDAAGRVWVSGSGWSAFLSAFTPVWDGQAAEIIRYTPDNSNYQVGYPDPILLPDGQIWSFDKKIATFDTTRTELPDPLPEWFASLNWPLLYFATLIAMLLAVIILSILANRRFSPRKPPPAFRE